MGIFKILPPMKPFRTQKELWRLSLSLRETGISDEALIVPAARRPTHIGDHSSTLQVQ